MQLLRTGGQPDRHPHRRPGQCVHLPRMRGAVPQHHQAEPPPGDRPAAEDERNAQAQRDQRVSRPVRDRPGQRQEIPVGGRPQSLQAAPAQRHRRQRRRDRQIQRPADRPDRLRQDAAGPDVGQEARSTLRDLRRHDCDRSDLGGRRNSAQAAPGGGLRYREARRGIVYTSTKSTRSARPIRTSPSRATSRARGSSRPF